VFRKQASHGQQLILNLQRESLELRLKLITKADNPGHYIAFNEYSLQAMSRQQGTRPNRSPWTE
jgi:hypothetical protein